jgi:hypothetical protein
LSIIEENNKGMNNIEMYHKGLFFNYIHDEIIEGLILRRINQALYRQYLDGIKSVGVHKNYSDSDEKKIPFYIKQKKFD